MRCEAGGIRAGRRHVERMRASAEALGLPPPREQALLHAVAVAAGSGTVVRVALHDEGGAPVVEAVRRAAPSTDAVRLVSLPGWYARGYELREHKLTSHFHGVRGRALAHARGADDAVLVERASGLVGEATNANVLVLLDGVAVTPPVDGLLPGVTRAICLELLPALGLPVEERPLRLDELRGAAGVLLTTSARGLVAACSLDGAALRMPGSDLLAALRAALDRAETAELLALPLP